MASNEKETLSLYQQIQQIAQETLSIREKESEELLKQGKILKQAQTLSTKELDKQTESTDKFSNSLRNAAKEAVDLEEKTNSSLVGVSAAMNKLGKASSYAAGTVTRFKGILGGFSGIVKGTAGFLGQVVSSIFNVSKAIFAIPIKLFTSLFRIANSGGDNSFLEALERVREAFGSFKEGVSRDVVQGFRIANQGIKAAGLNMYSQFQNAAAALDYFNKLAQDFGSQISQFQSELRTSAGQLYVLKEGLGVTGEQFKSFANAATISGTSLQQQGLDAGNLAIQLGKSFDIPSKLLGRDMGEMMKNVATFGSLTKSTMITAAVYTRKLGLEVKSLQGLIAKFDTFEDAAESASMLSQAFGASVDAFKLMNEQDPAKRLDELRKSFMATGKSVENMSRQELKLLSSTVGLTEEETKLAFARKNQGVSYDEVKKKAGDAERAQLNQSKVMNLLGDNIPRIVRAGQTFKSILDAILKGFAMAIKMSEPFRELMIAMRQLGMEAFRFGHAIGQVFVKTSPFGDMLRSLTSFTRKFRDTFIQLKGTLSGNDTFGTLAEKFKSIFAAKNVEEDFTNFKNSLTKMLGYLAKQLGSVVAITAKNLASGLKNITQNAGTMLSGAGSTGKGIVSAIFGGFMEGAGGAAGIQQLASDLWETFKKALGGIVDFFTSKSGEITKTISSKGGKPEESLGGKILKSLIGEGFSAKGVTTIVGVAAAGAFAKVSGAGIAGSMIGPLAAMNENVGKAITAIAAVKVVEQVVKSVSGMTSAIVEGSKSLNGADTGSIFKFFGFMALVAGSVTLMMIPVSKMLESVNDTFKNVDLASMGKAFLAMTGIITLSAGTAAIATQVGKIVNSKDTATGLLAIGVTMAGIAGFGWLVSKMFKGVGKQETENLVTVGDFMFGISKLMLMTAPVLLAATAIGAALLTGGPVLLAAGVGLAAMAGFVGVASVAAIKIIDHIRELSFGPNDMSGLMVFNTALDSILKLADAMKGLMGQSSSVLSYFVGPSDKDVAMLQTANQSIKLIFVTTKDIIDYLISAAQQFRDPGLVAAGKQLSELIKMVFEVVKIIQPPEQLLSEGTSIINRIFDSGQTFSDMNFAMNRYTENLVDNLFGPKGFIPRLVTQAKVISQTFNAGDMKGIDAFSKLVPALTSVISSIIPKPEQLSKIKEISQVTTSDALGNKSTVIDVGPLQKYFDNIKESTASMIKLIKDDLSGFINIARGFAGDEKSLKGIDAFSKILGAYTSIVSAFTNISNSQKSKQTVDVSQSDKGVSSAKKMIESAAPIGDIINQIKDSIPQLVLSVSDLMNDKSFSSIISNPNINQKLSGLKTFFETIGIIANAGTSLNVLTKDVKGNELVGAGSARNNPLVDGMVRLKESLAMIVQPEGDGQSLLGKIMGFVSQVPQTINNSQNAAGKGLTESVNIATSSIKSTIELVSVFSSLETSLKSIDAKNFEGIQAISTSIQKTIAAMSSIANEPLDSGKLVTKLEAIPKGLGGEFKRQIKTAGIVVNLDLKVTMEAGAVETAILTNKGSILYDAIDELTNIQDTDARDRIKAIRNKNGFGK